MSDARTAYIGGRYANLIAEFFKRKAKRSDGRQAEGLIKLNVESDKEPAERKKTVCRRKDENRCKIRLTQ